MFTLTFFDGSVRHVRPDQADAIREDLLAGKKHILVDGSLIALSAVSRIDPSGQWLDDQREKAWGDQRYCDFGHKHGRREECDCVTKLRLPLTEAAARSLLADLVDARRDDTLSAVGKALWEKSYPHLLTSAYPDLRRLL